MSEEVKAPRPPKRAPKKKVCVFCVAKHQRPLATAIKRARVMALLPYKAD